MQVLRNSSPEVIEEYLTVMRREVNPSKEYQRLTRFVLSKIDVMTATQTDIMKFLDSLRKPESVDPMHKWIGTYNLYIIILKRFFKWFNNPYCIHSIGIDTGFGSSNTAIVATEYLKEESKIRVVYTEEFEHGDPQRIVNLIFDLYKKYGFNSYIWIDGANRAFVNLLKITFNESLSWEKQSIRPEVMRVLPVNFGTEHKQMLSHLALIISKQYLCVPKQYDKLEIALRTAYANEYSLDKEQSSYSDSLDALRLACKMYRMN